MIAFDTNVLIYACDKFDVRRQQIAFDLIADTSGGILLWQVACEFLAASRKLGVQGFTAAQAWARLAEFRALLPLVLPSAGVLDRARALHLEWRLSFWDATVFAACAEAGVRTLYSEDLPGSPSLDGLSVVNPFA